MNFANMDITKLNEKLENMLSQSSSAGNLSAVDQLFDLMDRSLKKQQINGRALENGAVYIVDKTEAEKGILFNYLAGKNLKVVKDGNALKLFVEDPEHSGAESDTIYPLTFRDDENQIAFFEDHESELSGRAERILNSYFKNNISKVYPKVQILLVIDYNSLANGSESMFVKCLKTFGESLENFELMSAHTSLVFTRVPRNTTVEDALGKLGEILAEEPTNLGESKGILKNIVDHRKVALFMEPSNDQVEKRYENPQQENVGREGILNMLKRNENSAVLRNGLFKVNVSEAEKKIIEKILLNSTQEQNKLGNKIVSSVKSTLIKKIGALEDVEVFRNLDNDPIITNNGANNTELEVFFREKLEMDISKDYSFIKMEFFNHLLGKPEFEIKFDPGDFVKTQLNSLNIKELFSSELVFENSSDSSKVILKGFNINTDAFTDGIFQQAGSHISQVRIQAAHMVTFKRHLDFNALSEKLKDASLSIIAPVWKIEGNIKIDLSGKDGVAQSGNEPETSVVTKKGKADKKRDGEAGENGIDGRPGISGLHGRNFLGIGSKLICKKNKLIIYSNGGNGTNGQDGTNGGDGGDGGNFDEPFYPSFWEQAFGRVPFSLHDYDDQVYKQSEVSPNPVRIDGGKGGKGGDAGKGGQGGYGGKPGTVDIFVPSDACMKIVNKGGSGIDGKHGMPGKGGKDGNMEITYSHNMIDSENSWYESFLMKANTSGADGEAATVLIPAIESRSLSCVSHEEMISYEKFLISYFGKEGISREIALEALKNFINSSKIVTQSETNGSISSVRNPSIKFGIQYLIDEQQVLNDLYANFLNQKERKLTAQNLMSLYERALVKIIEFGRHYKEDHQVLLILYANIIMALNSLKSAYTVINFDYLKDFSENDIVEYDEAVKQEKIAQGKKDYDKKIQDEIDSAKKCQNDLESAVKKLITDLETQINGLKSNIQNTQNKKDEYAKQLEIAAKLKIAANIIKMIGGTLSFLGPYGVVAGGLVSVGGLAFDMVAPDAKTSSLGELSPASFLELKEEGENLFDPKKFIDILENVYDKDVEIKLRNEVEKLDQLNRIIDAENFEPPIQERLKREEQRDRHKQIIDDLTDPTKKRTNKQKYVDQLKDDAKKDPKKFVLDNCRKLEERKDQAEILNEEQKTELNTLELKKEKLRRAEYVAVVTAAVQVAQNIASIAKDCLEAKKNAENALEDAKGFSEKKSQVEEFINQSIQGLEKHMSGFSSSLAQADSHAQIDFLKYGFKMQIQRVIDYFHSTLKNYEYAEGSISKAELFNVLSRFESLTRTLADIQQRIADANDKKHMANLIAAVGEPSVETLNSYKNLSRLVTDMKGHLLIKEANDILYSFKQSQFPFAPYYSHAHYKKAFKLEGAESIKPIIKEAYKCHELNKYALTNSQRYTIHDGNFTVDDVSNKRPFSTWRGIDEPAKFTALLNGQSIILNSDICYSPKGADAIKFKKLNLKLKLRSNEEGNKAQDLSFQQELSKFKVELSSSGEYNYRYNGKYYTIPSIPISLTYDYAGGNCNGHYEKIAKGDPIFSPYTAWSIKLRPVDQSQTDRDSLYRKFGTEITNMELYLVGIAQYIDMEAFDEKASEEILIDECYKDFLMKEASEAILD